jgi:uncharacterized membrane protein YoaK (UPF0700 family)
MTPPAVPSADHTAWQACVLAAVAGYADTVCFLKSGVFAGLMSGNTVLTAIALVQRHFVEAAHSASIIAAFLAGVAIAGALLRRGVPLPVLLAVEALLMVTAAFTPYPWTAPTLAIGMGVQNAAASQFGGAALNTVFITGDLQKLVQALLPAEPRPAAKANLHTAQLIAGLWLSYLCGAALGAAAFASLERPMLWAPLALPLALLPTRRAVRRP